MKKVVVLIYEQFCNFEISVALKMLTMGEKSFVIISKTLNPIRREECIKVIADKTIEEVDLTNLTRYYFQGLWI